MGEMLLIPVFQKLYAICEVQRFVSALSVHDVFSIRALVLLCMLLNNSTGYQFSIFKNINLVISSLVWILCLLGQYMSIGNPYQLLTEFYLYTDV